MFGPNSCCVMIRLNPIIAVPCVAVEVATPSDDMTIVLIHIQSLLIAKLKKNESPLFTFEHKVSDRGPRQTGK